MCRDIDSLTGIGNDSITCNPAIFDFNFLIKVKPLSQISTPTIDVLNGWISTISDNLINFDVVLNLTLTILK